MIRHSLWNVTPARECITLFSWGRFRGDGCSLFHLVCLVNLTINLVCQYVLYCRILCKCSCHCHIMIRHSLWYITPTRECIAFFCWGRLGSDSSPLFNLIGFVNFTINLVCQFVLCCRFLCKRSCNCHIVIWHRLWNLTPARECIAFLCWCRLWGNHCSLFNLVCLVNLSINLVCEYILCNRFFSERSRHSHIMIRHRFWNLTPTRERITFLRWCRFWGDLCTIFNLI